MPSTPKKATDEELIAAYKELGNIWRVAERFGMCGQSVQERLVRLGVPRKNRVFTDEERERLRRDYVRYRDAGRVKELAQEMGRTVPFLSRQARRLGLTSYSHPRKHYGKWKYMTEAEARALFEEFKISRYTMTEFCTRKGLDDLGFSRTMQRFFPDEWDAVIEAKAPRESMYRRGRAFEYRVRDDLRSRKYFVLRSPRSGSPVDLVAIKPGKVLFVQCKRHGQLLREEWNTFYELACSVDAEPILAATPTGRGIKYWRLTGKKDGSKRPQPYESYRPE